MTAHRATTDPPESDVAVLNTALAVDPDEDRQHVFFDLIDRLPPAALRLLEFVADPLFREDVIGYQPPASRDEMVFIADIAHLITPNPVRGESSGDLESFLNGQCLRLKDENLLSLALLAKRGTKMKATTLASTLDWAKSRGSAASS